jgi:hypothetical protein
MPPPSVTDYDTIDESIYLSNPVYQEVSDRLLGLKPPISLREHIDVMKELGRTHSEGVTFLVKDAKILRTAVVNAKNDHGQAAFHWDDRKVFIFFLAALFTDGEGYREIGQPSLHCAIGNPICNIHIDDFGFLARGSDGKEYITPDALRHIVDELVFRAKIRPVLIAALKKVLPHQIANPAAKLFDNMYFRTPSSQNNYDFGMDDKFHPRVGVGVNIVGNKTVEVRFEYTCGNLNCTDRSYMVNVVLNVP